MVHRPNCIANFVYGISRLDLKIQSIMHTTNRFILWEYLSIFRNVLYKCFRYYASGSRPKIFARYCIFEYLVRCCATRFVRDQRSKWSGDRKSVIFSVHRRKLVWISYSDRIVRRESWTGEGDLIHQNSFSCSSSAWEFPLKQVHIERAPWPSPRC